MKSRFWDALTVAARRVVDDKAVRTVGDIKNTVSCAVKCITKVADLAITDTSL